MTNTNNTTKNGFETDMKGINKSEELLNKLKTILTLTSNTMTDIEQLSNDIKKDCKQAKKDIEAYKKYYKENLHLFLSDSQLEEYKKGKVTLKLDLKDDTTKNIIQYFLDTKETKYNPKHKGNLKINADNLYNAFYDDIFNAILIFNNLDVSDANLISVNMKCNSLGTKALEMFTKCFDGFTKRNELLNTYLSIEEALTDKELYQKLRNVLDAEDAQDLKEAYKNNVSKDIKSLIAKVEEYQKETEETLESLNTGLPVKFKVKDNVIYFSIFNSEEILKEKNNQLIKKVSTVKRERLTPVRMLSLMNDKTQHVLVETDGILNTEVNGQLSVMFATNLAKASNKNMQVPVYISLLYEGNNNLKTSKRVTMYQNALFSAICTFHNYQKETGAVYFTDQEIWRIMNGKQPNDSKARAKPNQLTRVNQNLEQLGVTRLTMDITEEIKNGFISLNDERLTGGTITDYFINITKVTFETENHKKVTGYRLNTEPLLYTYQLAKDHILNAPLELLDVSDKISNSEYVTEFKLYLLQQIILLKNGYRDNNAFRLDTIYEKTGIPTPLEEIENKTFKNANTRKKELSERRKKDRKKIEGILESWKEKSFIKDFKRDKDSYIVEVEKQEVIDVESNDLNH